MSDDLTARAHAWVQDVHPHARHLTRTLDWLDELDPHAHEAARVAAVTHDIERAFPDPTSPWDSARDWASPAYNRAHQDRCADLLAAWLAEQDADPAVAERAVALVRVHEDGGWPEADLVQAADSLSFLEVMDGLVAGWVLDGRAAPASAAGKLQTMHDRISAGLPHARELAGPLLAAALARVDAAAATTARRSA